jgi:hypothetical protein
MTRDGRIAAIFRHGKNAAGIGILDPDQTSL